MSITSPFEKRETYNISSFIDDLVPQHIVDDHPELIEFIKVYAYYMEKVNASGFYLNQLDIQRDIDHIETKLLNELQNEIGAPIPRTFASDPRLFYRRLGEFYRSRGTPESIDAFFRLIYNDDVEVYFPKEDMLIPSDGKFYSQEDDIVNHYQDHTPVFTFTLTSNTNTIDFNDDYGYKPKFDDDVVFVNNIIQYPTEKIVYNNSTEELDHSLVFDYDLTSGDVITVYRRGLFTTADGFISDKKYIQDSYFYQKFSYVLKTGKNITEWKNSFTRLIHPAGFIFFGEILILVEAFDLGIPSIQPGYQREGLPRTINIQPAYATSSFVATGHYIEKEYTHIASANKFGSWDHFDNTKFVNWRQISEYQNISFGDVINKTIGTHIGCQIIES